MGCRFLSLRVGNNESNLKQGSHAHWFQRNARAQKATANHSHWQIRIFMRCLRLSYKLHCHSMRAFANEWKSHSHMSHRAFFFFLLLFIIWLSLLPLHRSTRNREKVLNFIVSFLRVFFFFFFFLRTNEFIMCAVRVFGELVAFGIDLLATRTSNTTKTNNRDHRRMQTKNVKKKNNLLRLSCCVNVNGFATELHGVHGHPFPLLLLPPPPLASTNSLHVASTSVKPNAVFRARHCSRSHFSSFARALHSTQKQRLSSSD